MISMLIIIIIHNPTAAWGGKKTHWQADRSCSCLRSYWALNKSNGLFGFCLTCYSLLQKFKSNRFFRAATCLACLDHIFFGKQSIHSARLLYIFKWWSLFCWCTNLLYSKECDLSRNAISHIENMLRDMASTLNSRGTPELRKLAVWKFDLKLSIHPWQFACKFSTLHWKFACKLAIYPWKSTCKVSIKLAIPLKVWLQTFNQNFNIMFMFLWFLSQKHKPSKKKMNGITMPGWKKLWNMANEWIQTYVTLQLVPLQLAFFSWKNEASCRFQEDFHLEPVDNESGSHPNAKATLIWTAIIMPKVILRSNPSVKYDADAKRNPRWKTETTTPGA